MKRDFLPRWSARIGGLLAGVVALFFVTGCCTTAPFVKVDEKVTMVVRLQGKTSVAQKLKIDAGKVTGEYDTPKFRAMGTEPTTKDRLLYFNTTEDSGAPPDITIPAGADTAEFTIRPKKGLAGQTVIFVIREEGENAALGVTAVAVEGTTVRIQPRGMRTQNAHGRSPRVVKSPISVGRKPH